MSVRYRHTVLRAGKFRLDAGSMFGLIPRAVWSRTVPADEHGRVELEQNCLLLERVAGGGGAPGPERVLIEVGSGDKLDAKGRGFLAMEGRTVVDALGQAGVSPEGIGAVVVSHLHFDHAGALTRLAQPGERPEWVGPANSFGGPRGEHGVVATFPNAQIYVQRRELADALANRSVMTRTYFADHVQAARPRLVVVDSPAPFAAGQVPDRGQRPAAPLEDRQTEIVPGVFVFCAPGHTWGQQAVWFESAEGGGVCFVPDVMPTAWHAGAAYSLGYDVEPYTSMITRGWLLEEAAARGWRVVPAHHPGAAEWRVERTGGGLAGGGWYELREAPAVEAKARTVSDARGV